jgi:hypothetical protein
MMIAEKIITLNVSGSIYFPACHIDGALASGKREH